MNTLLLSLALWVPFAAAQEAPESVLPEKTHFYMGITNFPDDLEWAREILKEYCAEGADTKLFAELMKFAQMGLDELPEGMAENALKALRTVKSVHVAMAGIPGPNFLPILLVIESSDTGAIEALLPEGLPTKKRGGHVVYEIKKPTPVWFTFTRNLVIVGNDAKGFEAALKRLDGGGRGIAAHARYKQLGAPHAVHPEFRAFLDLQPMLAEIRATLSRRERWDYDATDAFFEYSKVRGAVMRATLEDGTMRTRLTVDVEPDCAIFELVHMKPGDLSSLGMVPKDALYAASVTLQDVPGWLKKLKDRVDPFVRAMSRGRDTWEEFEEEFEKLFGSSVEDAAAAIGPDLTNFAWIDEGKERDFERRGTGECFVMKIADREAVDEFVEAFTSSERIPFEEREYGGVTIHVVDDRPKIAFAVVNDHLVAGMGLDTIKRVIDAVKAKETLLDVPRVKKALAALPAERAKVAVFNLKAFCTAMSEWESDFPEFFAEALADDAIEIGVITENDSGLTLDVMGPGAAGFTVLGSAAAIVAIQVTRARTRAGPAAAAETEEFEADPDFKVPEEAAERDRLIDRYIRRLAAEEVAERDRATRRLWQIGKPAVNKLVRVHGSSEDREVRARAEAILLALGEYDAVPEVLDRRLRSLLEGLEARNSMLVYWDPAQTYPWSIEPYLYTYMITDHAMLSSESSLKRLAAMLPDEANVTRRVNIAALLMAFDSGAATEAILKHLPNETDVRTAALLRCAVGWGGEEGRRSVIEGLEGDDLASRRAGFMAADRAAHPEVVDALLKLLDSKDQETRFNAAYTLERLTGGAIEINGFWPEKRYAAAAERARDWWGKNRGTVKLQRAAPERAR